jgi:gas vesicle protein
LEEEVMGHKEECSCGGIGKLLVGGLLGAGIALLLAPQTGKKTRKYLSCFAKDMTNKANDAANEFADNLSDWIDAAGDKAADILHQGADLTSDSKKSLLKALEKGQTILEKQRKRLEDMID